MLGNHALLYYLIYGKFTINNCLVYMQFEVVFFKKSDGTVPVKDFIQQQPYKAQAKILRLISALSYYGNQLREPDSKMLSDGIFELRTKGEKGQVRILYFFYIGRKIVLTNAFIKKTRKTPLNELEQAKKYKREFVKLLGA